MRNKETAIRKAIKLFGSQTALAKELNITKGQVWQWLNNVSPISAERCIEIERITKGEVVCEDLRPDINWAVLRNSSKQ